MSYATEYREHLMVCGLLPEPEQEHELWLDDQGRLDEYAPAGYVPPRSAPSPEWQRIHEEDEQMREAA